MSYIDLGYNVFLEKSGSLLDGYKELQLYSTVSIDPDTGAPATDQVSTGLSTINTEKLSQAEVDQLLGKIKASSLSAGDISQPINVVSGYIQSGNFTTGSVGWRIDADGNVEFNTGTFRADVIAAAIHIPDTTTANSFHVDSEGNAWWGATAIGSAVAKVLKTGAATFTNVTITGVQAGSSINGAYIQNLTITGDKLVNATITGAKIDSATITGTNIASGTITGANIGSGTITGTNIGTGTITGANIDSATITGTNIGSGTITSANIANGTITGDDIANATINGSNISSATITGTNIDTGTITSTNIQNGTITASDIATATITGSQIATGTIQAVNIAAATITGTEIQNGTITAVEIANQTIIATNIANGSITTTQINATAGITGTQIANSTITGDNITNNTITIGKSSLPTHIISGSFVDNSPSSGRVRWEGVTVDYNGTTYSIDDDNTLLKYIWWDYSLSTTTFQTSSTIPTLANEDCLVATNTSGIHKLVWNATDVSGDMIQLAAITGSNIASSTIQGSNIASNTISGSNINSATITGSNIANNTIAGNNLVNNTITATQIANATITGTQITGSTITGDHIATNTITGTNITSATITGSNVQSNTITGNNIATNTITAANIVNATITGTQIASATITGTNIASATIVATNIATGTITATQIANLAITAAQIANLTITSDKINSVTVDKLAAGTITSKAVTLAVSAGTGDVYFNAGKTDFDNTVSGFILGIDDSDDDTPKFYIGDTNNYLNWDGTSLTISGKSSITGIVLEAGEDLVAGDAVYLKKSNSKLYKTSSLYNSEEIYEFKGIVQTDTTTGNDATLISSGVVAGQGIAFTGTVTETLDYNQWTVGSQPCSTKCDGPTFYFITGDFVANITKATVKLIHSFAGDQPAYRYITSATLTIGGVNVSGSKTNLCTTNCTGSAGQNFSVDWTFTFDSPITLQPRTEYSIAITYVGGETYTSDSHGVVYWEGNGSGYTCNTLSPLYGRWSNESTIPPLLKTYYTDVNYCDIGDNIYLSNVEGGLDYIPGTYQKAIGTIISSTEILLPHEPEKLISIVSRETSILTSISVPVPRNARKAIITYAITGHSWDFSAEMTLINPIKMDGRIASDIGNNQLGYVSATWSNNIISISAYHHGIATITFLT
jgi:uncharacterized protein YjbI with pentapeptide repeats